MFMVDTCVRVVHLMIDNDESSIVTADLTTNLASLICCVPRRTATIMTLRSATVHPFLPASSNGCIASTHMTSDFPICATSLFQSNDTTSFKP
ncbi:hypothetical protein TNCV_1962721 [Trichonephila clavipes]|nr:hypothetical protein TNCV_1962721 [Trichonephila clavipes]